MRRRFRYRKVGHAGTLDPMAEGVLVLGLGRRATRRLGALMTRDKEYDAVMVLGVKTDSQDATGTVIERRNCSGVAEERIREVLERFKGPLLQTPPMYSAVKHKGRPLYKLARRGLEVQRKARAICVYDIELCGFSSPEVRLKLRCSKGTYVRTLCSDIGDSLGCGAHLASLLRTRVGEFNLGNALPLSDVLIMSAGELEDKLVQPECIELLNVKV